MYYYQVAVEAKFSFYLTYSFKDLLSPGQLVEVPLRSRSCKAVIVEQIPEADVSGDFETKEILLVLEQYKTLPKVYFDFFQWMSRYYHYALGLLVGDCLPDVQVNSIKRKKDKSISELSTLAEKSVENLPYQLTKTQDSIIDDLWSRFQLGPCLSLLFGITGSGKTSIYLQIAKKILETKKSILFLVPEINLTPQLLETLSRYLPVPVLSYHSGVTKVQKSKLYKQITDSERNSPVCILGARSALFLPIKDLGLIIIDEEHDLSFKQDDRCTYHARDCAIKLASLLKIPVILGSATPSLESYYQCKQNHKVYFLTERPGGAHLPKVVFEQDEELKQKTQQAYVPSPNYPLSSSSLEKIERSLERGEQVLVFINRLGHASLVKCFSCGHSFECPNCDVPLKLFSTSSKRQVQVLKCQYCQFERYVPKSCEQCGNLHFVHQGYGTEKIQAVLKSLFPAASIERFDRDEISTFKQLQEKLDDFHQKKIDIFIGTQMLAKGHNFKSVNTVIILGSDLALQFPDFRAEERLLQVLFQISGRAGRYGTEGEVVVQTASAELPIFQYLEKFNYQEFLERELSWRRDQLYPPFIKLMTLYISANHRNYLLDFNKNFKSILQKVSPSLYKILGPNACSIERKKNKLTWYYLFHFENFKNRQIVLSQLLPQLSKFRIEWKIDIDPQQFF